MSFHEGCAALEDFGVVSFLALGALGAEAFLVAFFSFAAALPLDAGEAGAGAVAAAAGAGAATSVEDIADDCSSLARVTQGS